MPEDETAVPGAVPEEPAAPEGDPTMEVADAEATGDPAATEVGTAVPDDPTPDDPVPPDPTPDPLDNPGPEAADEDDDEDDEEDELSAAEKQANYEPPPVLSQAEHVQGLMVAGATQGQAERRKTLARNREIRAQQHAALHRTNRPDNA